MSHDFLALTVDGDDTLGTIQDFHRATGYTLDPHTAVGVKAGRELAGGDYPVVCLATAHPAKFGEAVRKSIGSDPERPASLEGIESREKRCVILDADAQAVKDFLQDHAI